MGIFDFFKKNSTNHAHEEILRPDEKLVFKEIKLPERTSKPAPYLWAYYKKEEPNDYEGYFKNGGLYNVKPRNKRISLYEDRGVAYCARYIISDGIKYDLEDPDSIASMKIPVFDDIHGMPNTTSDLGYIMKVRANAENRPVLAVPLVYKAANLMMASPIWWQKKDYYQIIKHLWLIGEIDYADNLVDELNKRLPFMTDDEWEVDAQIEYMTALSKQLNSPITAHERKAWEEGRQNTIAKEQQNARYYSRDYWIGKYKKHLEYQQVVEIMGEKAPKSYSGYQRMKKNNTANFQKILKAAEEHNIKINQDSVLQK